MKRILVNATQQEELRVAIVDGQKLYNLDIEATGKKQKKGNIYKGVITSIAPSLNAVFVDYGGVRQGFLPVKEIYPRYFINRLDGPIHKQAIHKLVEEGQELIVQIVREEISNKGASLSTYVSLTGQYLILMPNKSRVRGISQRISEEERRRLLNMSHQLENDENEGIILRTSCLTAEKKDLQKNLDYLHYLWEQIQKSFDEQNAPFLIYKEANIVLQTIQNNLGPDISEITIDNQEIYEETKNFLSMVAPHFKKKLKLYQGNPPLFNRMQIESQIETLYQHKIDLPSGASIVLDHTEALTSIDINSARSTRQSDLEETALETNLEAVDEIARQLRLRDLGGLLVIDFIDMISHRNQRKVVAHFQSLLKKDRARTRLGNISQFGLLEMSRQRLRPSLKEESEILCPRCSGRGFIRTIKSCALVVLRLIEEEASKEKTVRIVGQIPGEVNKFLINEKRTELDEIEQHYNVKVSIVVDPQMETPHYKIMRHKENGNTDDSPLPNSVSVRSSLYEQHIHDKQNRTGKVIDEEKAAVPTVITMPKATFFETIGKLRKKLFGIFSLKKTPTKQSYRPHTKHRNYPSKRSSNSYRNQSQYKKTQNRDSSQKYRNYKKPTQTKTASRQRNTTEQQSVQHKKELMPHKSSTHSNRNRRQYQKPKTHTQEDKHQSLPHPHQPAEQIPSTNSPSTEKNNPRTSTPQKTKKDSIPNNIFNPPQIKKEKPKLIQIETKSKINDAPK